MEFKKISNNVQKFNQNENNSETINSTKYQYKNDKNHEKKINKISRKNPK